MIRHLEARAFLARHVPDDVATRVLERVAAHDAELDESYRWQSIPAMVRELSEEPLDTIGWGALLSCRLGIELGETPTAERAAALLAAIAQSAAATDALVGELRRLLQECAR
jgi:ATP-dependent exoDNAse (exonuclease V) beta subunit